MGRSHLVGIALATAMVGTLTVGCGGSGDATGETDLFSFDKTKHITELSATEQQQVCEVVFSVTLQNLSEPLCTAAGLAAAAASDQSCATIRDACVSDLPTTESCAQMGAISATCTITVGELETCMKDWTSALQSALPSMSCESDPSIVQQIDTSTLQTMPSSCQSLSTSCPDLAPASG